MMKDLKGENRAAKGSRFLQTHIQKQCVCGAGLKINQTYKT